MAVPKGRQARSRTRHRRSQWKSVPSDLVPVRLDGEVHRVPRRLVRALHCGLMEPPS
ncbi:MAG TPA: 50S ribosomal protein L32 [Propionicimonas sp.]|nr:50S ribosomal protein L32 [Propionicimonas sp.]